MLGELKYSEMAILEKGQVCLQKKKSHWKSSKMLGIGGQRLFDSPKEEYVFTMQRKSGKMSCRNGGNKWVQKAIWEICLTFMLFRNLSCAAGLVTYRKFKICQAQILTPISHTGQVCLHEVESH
jgi:hypothetical protein